MRGVGSPFQPALFSPWPHIWRVARPHVAEQALARGYDRATTLKVFYAVLAAPV